MSNFREELKKPLRKMLSNFAPQHTVDVFLETYAEEYFDQIIELVKGEIILMKKNEYKSVTGIDGLLGYEQALEDVLAKLEEKEINSL